MSDLKAQAFTSDWTGKPFILTSPVKRWPLYSCWSVQTLLDQYSQVRFRAEAVDWPLNTYVQYMRNNVDESPLYLFDRSFHSKMLLSEGANGDYQVPSCFGMDLFSVLGPQRPDHRWLIMGPARSGSTFHKDPNATSAWNAVVRGSKYWMMFPSSSPPPGVFVSQDQSEVTSPLSIAEWLLGFHAEAREAPGCMEGVCGDGEVLHVPSGWWHLVINLEESIAITQNFVPERHLRNVIDFLKNKESQVSGFAKHIESPFALFGKGMQQKFPDLFKSTMDIVEQTQQRKKRKWNEATVEDPEEGRATNGFQFGFHGGEEDEIP
ncbi:MAG: hypothetical protein OHK93_007660 [Ramalina farinacea]|uniref:JmjC domain-containing protein n=1 Tax=Ramalina farinacea TaxID=258253 RepID=A0AA43TVR5_9LECA|nr:hypothetical protein [Ramalina farinacea]